MDDLVAWLTQIWDERQRACVDAQTAIDAHSAMAASGDLELRWMLQLRRGGVFQTGWTMPGPPTPAEDLARIAADRQILSRLRALEGESHEQWLDYTDWIDGAHSREHRERQHTEQAIAEIPGLIYALKCSALPHADRPGYQEAWRP